MRGKQRHLFFSFSLPLSLSLCVTHTHTTNHTYRPSLTKTLEHFHTIIYKGLISHKRNEMKQTQIFTHTQNHSFIERTPFRQTHTHTHSDITMLTFELLNTDTHFTHV